jgi:ribonuclease-3
MNTLSKKIKVLQEVLGYRYEDTSLLLNALVHKSFANENRSEKVQNNERLEFLGDAVLDLIVSEYLVVNYTHFDEGLLSKLRSAVVNELSLASISRRISLGDYVFLGKGEEKTGGREKNSILADTLEAIIASIYLDGGHNAAEAFILPYMKQMLDFSVPTNLLQNYKSSLQEYTQANMNCIPIYTLIEENGPEHRRIFKVKVCINDQEYGVGVGRRIKDGEQQAAKMALKKLGVTVKEFKT